MDNPKEQVFENILLSGNIVDVSVYHINDSYFEIPNPDHWFIDGGIQITFPAGVLTYAWSTDLDMFVFDSKMFNDIYTGKNFHILQKDNIHKLHKLKGETVHKIDWKWTTTNVDTFNGTKADKDLFLLELILDFKSKNSLQISAADYDLDAQDNPIKYRRLLDSQLLISLNHKFPLK